MCDAFSLTDWQGAFGSVNVTVPTCTKFGLLPPFVFEPELTNIHFLYHVFFGTLERLFIMRSMSLIPPTQSLTVYLILTNFPDADRRRTVKAR